MDFKEGNWIKLIQPGTKIKRENDDTCRSLKVQCNPAGVASWIWHVPPRAETMPDMLTVGWCADITAPTARKRGDCVRLKGREALGQEFGWRPAKEKRKSDMVPILIMGRMGKDDCGVNSRGGVLVAAAYR